MENSLKQRLVGAIVLIALAIIFLPSLLKEKENQAPFISKIPAKSANLKQQPLTDSERKSIQTTQKALSELDSKIKQQAIVKGSDEVATETEVNESVASLAQNNKVNQTKTQIEPPAVNTNTAASSQANKSRLKPNKTKTKPKQTINSDFKDAAWVIQVASFSSADNAHKFSEKLKNLGHKAYARKITTQQDKTFYRVNVGPYIKKIDAADALSQVNKDSGMKGLIKPFDPIKP